MQKRMQKDDSDAGNTRKRLRVRGCEKEEEGTAREEKLVMGIGLFEKANAISRRYY